MRDASSRDFLSGSGYVTEGGEKDGNENGDVDGDVGEGTDKVLFSLGELRKEEEGQSEEVFLSFGEFNFSEDLVKKMDAFEGEEGDRDLPLKVVDGLLDPNIGEVEGTFGVLDRLRDSKERGESIVGGKSS